MTRTKVQRINIGECLRAGWRNIAGGDYPLIVFVTIWCCVIGFAVALAAEFIEMQFRFAGLFFSVVADPLFFLFPFALVRTLRGAKFVIAAPAARVPALLRILGFGLVIRIFAAGCALSLLVPFFAVFMVGPILFLLSCLLPFAAAIVATYLTVRLCFTPFVLLDDSKGCTLRQAMARSWRLTREPVGSRVFILGLSTGFISLICLVCLVVPVVMVGLPLMCSVLAAAYEFTRPLRIEDARGEGPAAMRAGRCESCGCSRSGIEQDRCPECGEVYEAQFADGAWNSR